MNCSIYICTNLKNNKVYVGQTWSTISHRFSQHLCDKRATYFHYALKKYGKDNFKIECIAICSSQDVADYLETEYIIYYDSRNKNKGYNLTSGGSTGKHSEETKKKISKANMGNTYGHLGKGISHIIKNKSKNRKSKKSKLSDQTILAIKNDTRTYSKEIYDLYKISKTHYYRIQALGNKIVKKKKIKLSENDILNIKNSTNSIKEIAKKYNVSTTFIYRIRRGRR